MTAKEVTVISPRGRYLADYQCNRRVVAGGTYSVIHVPPVDFQALSGQGGAAAQDFAEWLDDCLENAVKAMPAHFIFGTDSHSAQAKLTVSITRLTPGSRALRMLVGEFGIGNARIEVAGKINDIVSNEELARFTHRKRSSGGFGFRDIGRDIGPQLVRELLEQTASGIIAKVKESFGF
jgi:hypothetical protein